MAANSDQSQQYDVPTNNSSLELQQVSLSSKTNNSDHEHSRNGGDVAEDMGATGKKSTGAVANAGAVKGLIAFAVLFLACLAGFSSRLFAVIRFESIIHEFDPWYVYMSCINVFVSLD